MAISAEQIEEVKRLAKLHFAFDTPNPGQLESIVWVVCQFLSGKKHVILQAPTGSGKSQIAVCVHKIFKSLAAKHRTTIITATKGLQDQYTEMDRDLYDLKGRTNYSCPYDKGPYNSGQCRSFCSKGGCSKAKECPYLLRRLHWCKRADLRLSNTSFQISAPFEICAVPGETRADLLVIDECHDIDDAIVDHTTIDFNPLNYAFLIPFGFGSFKKGLDQMILEFESYSKMEYFDSNPELVDICSDLYEEVNGIKDVFDGWLKQPDGRSKAEIDKIGDALDQLGDIGGKLSYFASADTRGKWIVTEWSKEKMTVKPVFAWQVADVALFSKCDFFLHMSATICGVEEYASTLGLQDYVYGEAPNPIPVENRMVYVLPKFKMNNSFSDFKGLGEFCGKLIARHAPDNGLIHCVSYKLGNNIYSNLPDRSGAFVSKDRTEILDEMMKIKTGRVCISASIEKGYDFKGDTARFQIIAKVPYGYLGDPLIKLNSEYRSGWYARKAVLRIVQACGRTTRGVTDHSTTYIIDSSFNRLYSQNPELFPEWFKSSVKFI